jgi:hypothetical protein
MIMSEADITRSAMETAPHGTVYPHFSAGRTGALVASLKWVFSMPAMLGAFLVGVVFLLKRSFFVDPDMWWHLKTGELILSTHRWATTDPYSYTSAGAPWLSSEWLGEVLLAVAYRLGGLRGLEALLIILGGAVIVALYVFATLRSGNSKAAFFITVPLIALASVSFNLRPQMVGYLFLILTLIVMERFRQGKQRSVWILPLLFMVWINTHGSWIIGLAAVGVYIASGLVSFQFGNLEARRWTNSERLRLEIVFMLSLAAIPITPYGTRLAVYPFMFAWSLPVNVAQIQEWQVMPFNIIGGKIFLALVLGFFLAQVLFRFSWRLEEFLLFLFGTAMACLHVRFLMLFVPFFAPLAAVILARWVPSYDETKDRYPINFAVMAGILIAMFYYFPSQHQIEEKVADQYPVRALQYLREHSVPGPLFNTYGYGGYMVEAGFKTFIDGRGDLFEATGVLADYVYIKQLKPGALQVLRGYGIRSVLMGRGEPLLTVLAASPDWRRVYADDVSELYVKQDGADAPKQAVGESLPVAMR